MNWNTLLGVACTISLFLPVLAILYFGLYRHRSLAALGISYLFSASYNLMYQGYVSVPINFQKFYGTLNNFTDVPLILTALLFFCPVKQKQKPVHIILIAFICYEIFIAAYYGFKPSSIVYIMGPGLVLVLLYTFYLFTRHIKITVEHGKNAGRTLMLASILFGYGGYSLVYIFYYVERNPNIADTLLLYFMISMLSCFIMTIGLYLTRNRLNQLKEVNRTRKELHLFFGME